MAALPYSTLLSWNQSWCALRAATRADSVGSRYAARVDTTRIAPTLGMRELVGELYVLATKLVGTALHTLMDSWWHHALLGSTMGW